MKRFKARSLALCGLLILAASLAPFAATAQCPLIVVDCGGGHTYGCAGIPQGTNCSYSQSCITGGKCGGRAPVVGYNVE